MRAHHGSLERAIIAVEVDAVLIFARVAQEAAGIQAGDEPETDIVWPMFLLEKLEHSERAGGFIAVNASGNVNAFARVGDDAAERGQRPAVRNADGGALPPRLDSELGDLRQHVIDVDSFALIAADVFSKSLH